MSIKINKNGKEYPIGVIPSNYIKKVDELENGVVIRTASKNRTFATQLAELYTAYSTLSESQKIKSAIKYGNLIFHCDDISDGKYINSALSSSSFIIQSFSLSANYYRVCNGGAVTDDSSTTNTYTLSLIII